ncbi:hypothetical protein QBC35DRAFT_479636 [Podospora australis]|uniref:Short chain dehydrogenase n=1 Tax=Podospora australis TaxID=1536484 RepID=A0AAN7APF4_9PEZI|nr:hypothetical protein QBC35DRAFT_479636 [Podospora australis]
MASNNKPVALVVGASRGIGRQIAIDLAKNGYAVVVSAKSMTPTSDLIKLTPFPPNPNSSASTITTVAREIQLTGGEATAIPVDTTSYESIKRLVADTISKYHRLDVLVYNSGAIWWAPVAKTPMKRFRLMQRVNVEGLYGTVQEALPHLKRSQGRMIVVCPPIYSRFFRGKTAYAMGKVGMSVLVKGLGMDFVREGHKDMAITGIWPAVAIESAATEQFTRKDPSHARDLRKPTIFSDAILAMLRSPAEVVNGKLELDEDFLRVHAGLTDKDFSRYSVIPGTSPRRIMPAGEFYHKTSCRLVLCWNKMLTWG